MEINRDTGLFTWLSETECKELVRLGRAVADGAKIDYLHPLLHAWVSAMCPDANTRELYDYIIERFPFCALNSALIFWGH